MKYPLEIFRNILQALFSIQPLKDGIESLLDQVNDLWYLKIKMSEKAV